MIAYLRGTVRFKRPSRVVLETGGVGYDVTIPVSTFYTLEAEGREAALHIHTHVREDALALFGFQTEREKALFEKLISISGVGPKLAVTILSGLEVDDLVAALRKGDQVALKHIPGVGPKLAGRLVLELRDKLDELALGGQESPAPSPRAEATGGFSAVEEDVLSALVNLGYNRTNAEAAVRDASKNNSVPEGDFEQILRTSLRLLARKFFAGK